MPLPLDSSCQAEYADGFILDETELEDVSPYDTDHNVFHAILNKLPETEHGKMVRFTMFWKNNQYDVDFSDLPDNARPIRYKKMEADFIGSVQTRREIMAVGFGYQYTDENGQNIQEVQEYV